MALASLQAFAQSPVSAQTSPGYSAPTLPPGWTNIAPADRIRTRLDGVPERIPDATPTGDLPPRPSSPYDEELGLPPGWRITDPRDAYREYVPPDLPKGASYNANGWTAERLVAEQDRTGAVMAWVDLVRSGGDWDYKRLDRRYEAAGNFNYGVTGQRLGFDERTLRVFAGAYGMVGSVRRNIVRLGGNVSLVTSCMAVNCDGRVLEAGIKEMEDPFVYLRVAKSAFGDDPRDQARVSDGYWYAATNRMAIDASRAARPVLRSESPRPAERQHRRSDEARTSRSATWDAEDGRGIRGPVFDRPKGTKDPKEAGSGGQGSRDGRSRTPPEPAPDCDVGTINADGKEHINLCL